MSVLLSPPEAPCTYAAIHGTTTLRADDSSALRDALAIKYTGQTYAEHNPDAVARHGNVDMTIVRVTPDTARHAHTLAAAQPLVWLQRAAG